jgi:hypothetical protein
MRSRTHLAAGDIQQQHPLQPVPRQQFISGHRAEGVQRITQRVLKALLAVGRHGATTTRAGYTVTATGTRVAVTRLTEPPTAR